MVCLRDYYNVLHLGLSNALTFIGSICAEILLGEVIKFEVIWPQVDLAK